MTQQVAHGCFSSMGVLWSDLPMKKISLGNDPASSPWLFPSMGVLWSYFPIENISLGNGPLCTTYCVMKSEKILQVPTKTLCCHV
jgi:hypothetical protein